MIEYLQHDKHYFPEMYWPVGSAFIGKVTYPLGLKLGVNLMRQSELEKFTHATYIKPKLLMLGPPFAGPTLLTQGSHYSCWGHAMLSPI